MALSERAGEIFTATRQFFAYASLAAVVCAIVSIASGWIIREAAVSADPSALMLIPVDGAGLPPEPDRAGTSREVAASKDSAIDFDHARPSPRLFERLSTAAAERVKASVRETVVAASSRDWYHGSGQTYRTVCVRLCDGAYFPISYSTTRARFAHDESVCKSRCAAPARLFAAPNPGWTPETMRDRDGASYVALPAAFQFRNGQKPGCGCRPEAWETASIDRHRAYAAVASGATESSNVHVANATAQESGRFGLKSTEPEPAGKILTTASVAAGQSAAQQTPDEGSPVSAVVAAVLVAPQELSIPPVTRLAPFASDDASGVGMPRLKTPREPSDVLAAAAPTSLPIVKAYQGKSKRRSARRERSGPGPKTLASFLGTPSGVAELNAVNDGRSESHSKPNWGRGPNSVQAPKGNSASEIFARNFY